MKRLRGLSLIELLICLSIIAFLATQLATPAFTQSRQLHAIDDTMNELANAIGMARAAAIAENVMVTFCRSDDGQRCRGRWEQGSILFTDANADRLINGRDRLLYRFPAPPAAGTISFNSFRNRQYLQLTPRGATNNQNGNFTFCPTNGDPTLARQLIINVTGRTRHAFDNDRDGIVENSEGKPVSCR